MAAAAPLAPVLGGGLTVKANKYTKEALKTKIHELGKVEDGDHITAPPRARKEERKKVAFAAT